MLNIRLTDFLERTDNLKHRNRCLPTLELQARIGNTLARLKQLGLEMFQASCASTVNGAILIVCIKMNNIVLAVFALYTSIKRQSLAQSRPRV